MIKPDKKRLIVSLHKGTHKLVELLAEEQGVTKSQIIEELLISMYADRINSINKDMRADEESLQVVI